MREEPRKNAGSGREGSAARDRSADSVLQALNLAFNVFNHGVDAAGATFGFGTTAQPEAASTGPMPEATITAAVAHYVYPECFDEALGELRSGGVVVLTGTAGQGKRTGAFALLRDVLPSGAPIVSLPPTAELRRLADRGYEAGYGYVVFDRFGTDGGREAEHLWQRISARIGQAGAYLIVTAEPQPRRAPECVRHVAWRRPPLGAALRAHMGDAVPDGTVDELVEHMPAGTTMADIVRVAGMVGDGAEPQAAVDRVLDQSKRREVREWFDDEPPRRMILDVTTLAFLVGADERSFDIGRGRLAAALESTIPVPEPAPADPDDGAAAEPAPARAAEAAMTQDRQRLLDNPLITLRREVIDGVPRRGMVFREDGHRRYVLEELAGRFGVGFWDAVRTWLRETARDRNLQVSIAGGLALLAYSAFDEIEKSYLNPWAAGDEDWPHRHTAVFALWLMCFDETLAPVALRTVVRWATHGDAEQRRTAVIAFSGDLGVRYPSEAANRLWQLVAQHNDLSEMAASGFGGLFGTLIARKAKADLMIQLVASRLRKTSPHGRTRLRYRWTLATAFAVVDARNPVGGRPAIAEYLADEPERIATVGRIWAALLKHRPIRHRSLQALLKALRALETLSTDAERDARALGDALGDALPATEHAALATDFTKLTRRSGDGRKHADALAQIMLAALGRPNRRNIGGMS